MLSRRCFATSVGKCDCPKLSRSSFCADVNMFIYVFVCMLYLCRQCARKISSSWLVSTMSHWSTLNKSTITFTSTSLHCVKPWYSRRFDNYNAVVVYMVWVMMLYVCIFLGFSALFCFHWTVVYCFMPSGVCALIALTILPKSNSDIKASPTQLSSSALLPVCGHLFPCISSFCSGNP